MILNKKAMFDIGLSILLIKLDPWKCWSFETGTFVLTGYFDISASRLTIIWVRSFIHTTYRCVYKELHKGICHRMPSLPLLFSLHIHSCKTHRQLHIPAWVMDICLCRKGTCHCRPSLPLLSSLHIHSCKTHRQLHIPAWVMDICLCRKGTCHYRLYQLPR